MPITLKSIPVSLISLLILSFLTGCASMAPPPGGAEDRTPPSIVDIYPIPGSTGVDPRSEIVITFSERIRSGTLEEALFITPPQQDAPRIAWHGSRAVIKLKEPIPADRTMSITIGSGVKDLRNNSLEQSVSFAFTAGDELDSGIIEGKIFSDDPIRAMYVGAWLMEDNTLTAPDSIAPPILTQAGEDGRFTLQYLADGIYRVMCWDDKNKDRLYQPGDDRIGIPCRDVNVRPGVGSWLEFFPQRRDTTRVFLLMTSASDNRHLVFKYSRFPALDLRRTILKTTITSIAETLDIIDGWYDISDSTRLALLTSEQEPNAEYLVHLTGDTSMRSFTGTPLPDTTAPMIIASYPSKGARDVPYIAKGWIGFSDALQPVQFTDYLTLTTSDSQLVSLETTLDTPVRLSWTAKDSIKKGEQCRISLDLNGIKDLSGNGLADTTWSSAFSVIDPVQYGSISGSITGIEGSRIIVKARLATGRYEGKSEQVGEDNTFKIDALQPGDYILWAFHDRDNDGVFDVGSLDPFWYAEYFTAHPDTVEVRQRWETGGVSIKFR